MLFSGMGFTRSLVEQVMRLKLTDGGKPYDTASSLLDAVLEYEGNGK